MRAIDVKAGDVLKLLDGKDYYVVSTEVTQQRGAPIVVKLVFRKLGQRHSMMTFSEPLEVTRRFHPMQEVL